MGWLLVWDKASQRAAGKRGEIDFRGPKGSFTRSIPFTIETSGEGIAISNGQISQKEFQC